MKFKVAPALAVVVVGLLLGGLIAYGHQLALRHYMAEGEGRTETALRLAVAGLDGHLRRYEAMPTLLSDHDDIRALAADPDNPDRRLALDGWLKDTNEVLQSSDIYVIGMDGETIAASNFDRPDSFVGQNFSYRPYFTEAVAGRTARFYALGTTSGVRGYYYSAPILDDTGAVNGVIVFKIGLDAIESSWQGGEYHIFVSDPEGIVFMSDTPDWLYTGLLPLTEERLARTGASRRYSDAPLRPLSHREGAVAGYPVMTVNGPSPGEYLIAEQTMPEADWTVHVALDTASVRTQARVALAAAVLLLAVAGFGAILLLQRRAREEERRAMAAAARAELEHRVDERTADLAHANARLGEEIAERKVTEKRLRQTQARLVQAGKLAALGQMSAALSHEINQPLAAARNYADSAMILLDRGEAPRARENVEQILSLIDRMAVIGKHLRNFARKPNQVLEPLPVAGAVTDALQILAPRLASAGAEVAVSLPPDLPPVVAGSVRLQQVLVNILSNAADAVESSPDRRIDLTAAREEGRVLMRIRDRGPGIPAAIADRIFDPFFSTKGVGAGLGLGLSISYNIIRDFGGDIAVAPAEGGGTVFTIVLNAAPPKEAAA